MKAIRELPIDGWFAVSDINIKSNEMKKVVLFDTPLILLKDSKEKIKAFVDACPHRGYPLSEGVLLNDDEIMCKYHGWCFNKQGECSSLPGLDNVPRFKLKEIQAMVFDNMIWVSLSENIEFNINHKRPNLDKSFTWEYKIDVPGYLLIENTLDPMHTPYIHAGLVRSKTQKVKTVDIIIKNTEKYVEAVYKNEGEQTGLISKLFSPPNVDGIGRFINPGVLELEFKSPEKTYISFTAYITPESSDRINVILKVNYAHLPLRMDVIFNPAFKIILKRVIQQDIDVCLKQYENLKNIPDFKYSSSKADYMIPYIDAFLAEKPKENGLKELKILI